MQNNQIITAGTALCKKRSNGKFAWLIIRQVESEGWELPKTNVRKGESSVRAVIRMMGEMGGMSARVIEEAGRFTGTAVVNNRNVSKRLLYYLMIQKSAAGEMIGFNQFKWQSFDDAVKKLESKREKEVMRKAKKELKIWTDDKKKRREEEEEEAAAALEEAELEKQVK